MLDFLGDMDFVIGRIKDPGWLQDAYLNIVSFSPQGNMVIFIVSLIIFGCLIFQHKQKDAPYQLDALLKSQQGSPRSKSNKSESAQNYTENSEARMLQVISKETIEQLRDAHNVRPISEVESNLSIYMIPSGRWGFVDGCYINTPELKIADPRFASLGDEWRNTKVTLKRDRGSHVEIHKLADGKILIIGYVSQDDLRRLGQPTTEQGFRLTLHFESKGEFKNVIAIPKENVAMVNYRCLDSGDSVFDLWLR
ncbi:MAG: hypothetical protein NPIRA01_05110 [Nitrospirales bacterium]|nr:MAG: hypothetical protein NPIRA01_05110 [Nitrospirales bacterium]